MSGLLDLIREARHRALRETYHMFDCVCSECEDVRDRSAAETVANWLEHGHGPLTRRAAVQAIRAEVDRPPGMLREQDAIRAERWSAREDTP
jgi:hypothetical protein